MADFSNLTYSVVSGAAGTIVSTGINQGLKYVNHLFGKGPDARNARFYYRHGDGGIINIMARNIMGTALSLAQQYAMDQLKALLFKKRSISNKPEISQLQHLVDAANKRDGEDKTIENKKYGVMPVNNGGDYVVATDFTGHWVPDAVMLGVPADPEILIDQRNIYMDPFTNERSQNTINSDTIVWWDVTGLITIQNDRKLILTTVSGRDYTRKELFGNGDVTFTISGRMNSNLPDVYPENEVRKFIKIMQYKGPVKIVSQMLDQYNITKCVINGYSLPQKEGYRNLQEYTINCVGIQPVEDVVVNTDTIIALNKEIKDHIQEKEKNKWQKLLDNTVEGLKSGAVTAAGTVASETSGMALSAVGNTLNKLI